MTSGSFLDRSKVKVALASFAGMVCHCLLPEAERKWLAFPELTI